MHRIKSETTIERGSQIGHWSQALDFFGHFFNVRKFVCVCVVVFLYSFLDFYMNL